MVSRATAYPGDPNGSRHNALKHGIFAKVALLGDEPRSEFDSILTGLQRDFEPKGTLEETLVEKVAVLLWRYRRFLKAEAESLKETFGLPDLIPQNVLHRIACSAEASLERSLDRTLSQLERFQRMRLGQPVLPKLEVHHSLRG